MGKFKPLLTYKGKSFIQNIILKLNSVCDKIIIVTGYRASDIEDNVNQISIEAPVKFAFNRNYEKGMFTSLKTGLSNIDRCDWVLYHFVDQPGLPERFYDDFITVLMVKFKYILIVFCDQSFESDTFWKVLKIHLVDRFCKSSGVI